MQIHFGLDLDNTIINYEHVFAPVAVEIGILPSTTGTLPKSTVKEQVRAQSGEEAWMRLQGQVYGRYINRAKPYEGFDEFFKKAMTSGVRISIVSHKTQFGHFDDSLTDLREAAKSWLYEHGYVADSSEAIAVSDVHFETTRDEKVDRIKSLDCQLFIDDLPEVLCHPNFPEHVEKLWFADRQAKEKGKGMKPKRNLSELTAILNEKIDA